MKKSDFYYDLPQELIAQTPILPRDSSRLLCYDRQSKAIFDRHFFDLPDLLRKGDVLVLNNTRVLPARIYGKKAGTGAAVEVLLHKRLSLTDWKALVRPAKRLQVGTEIEFTQNLRGEILECREEGERTIRFYYDGLFETVLEKIGEMPLPHYIREVLKDSQRYQTVYAKTDGSSAAPTAGLHFTPQLLEKIKAKGVEVAEVLLHVGLGTFRPVKTDEITDHKMHSEYYQIEQSAADTINKAVDEGRRVIAVGTTSVRVLESVADENGRVKPCFGDTSIFIYPPYKFKTVKGLITNFHLPESTLIMLVSAFMGREETLNLYQHAIKEKYRFFSFGDAMIIE